MITLTETQARVIEIITESPDTKTFRLRLDTPFSFIPGQFVMLTVDVPSQEKPLKRAYSVASSPQKNHMDITIKQEHKGIVSTYMVTEVKKGDVFILKGPYGAFALHDEQAKEIVCIGAGSGVTPFRSMVHHIKEKNLNINTLLFFSAKTEQDIIFRQDFEQSEQEMDNFSYIVTLTQPSDTWKGKRGRFTHSLIKEHTQDPNYYFICGPPAMVDDIRKQLITDGIAAEKIKVEKY